MHDTALITGKAFFECYGFPNCRILDVGSQDVNGSLRQFAPQWSEYVGVDLQAGPGVDVVLDDPYHLPFEDSYFDFVVSTSCLEHDQFFWLSFLEMVRVTSAYIYISAPSDGKVHRFPVDCWRFYPDAAQALAKWARHNNHVLSVQETFYMFPLKDVWTDNVMVFSKGVPTLRKSITQYLAEVYGAKQAQIQSE